MITNESTKQNKPTKKVSTKDLKILAVVRNPYDCEQTYYICFDGEVYYLMIGQQCNDPDLYFNNEMWD